MADKYVDAKQAYDEIDEMYKRNRLDAQEALRRGDDGTYRRLTAEGRELEKQRDAARRTYMEQEYGYGPEGTVPRKAPYRKDAPDENLGNQGYPSALMDADMHPGNRRQEAENLRRQGYPSSTDGTGAGGTSPAGTPAERGYTMSSSGVGAAGGISPAGTPAERGYTMSYSGVGADGTTFPEDKKDEAPVTPKSGSDSSGNGTGNTAASATGNTNNTNNTSSVQASPTPDAMAGHYSRDPAQATNKPAESPDKPGIGQMVKGAVNKLGRGFYEALANADSATFRRDVNAKLRGQMTGNIPDVRAETAQQAARLYENDAANRYMEAQREQQEGERNPFHEAGKIAESQQHAQNKQQINNSGFAGGTAQARLRTTVAPDVQAQKDFGARARQLASQYREKGDMRTRDANEEYGESKEWRVHSRDYNNDLDESARLSMGKGENTEGEDNKPAENTDTSQPAAETQPTAEQPAEQTAEEASGGLQNVVNAVLGSNVRRVKCENGAGAAYRVQPDGSFVRDPKNDVGQVPDNPPPYTAEMEQAVQQLTKSEKYGRRPGETDEQYKSRVNGEMGRGGNLGTQAFAQNYGNTVQSDSHMKNVQGDVSTVMSDLRMKFIKEDFDRYGELSPEDVKFVISRMGKKFSHNGRDYDIDDEDEWGDDSDTVLDGYAENIRNYVYNYKPEAQAIDSSIDPNQEHIGPMAQDIEKVNPACIIETPEGVKTVDTGRLAMMNAGAIGDLARRFDELEALVKNGR